MADDSRAHRLPCADTTGSNREILIRNQEKYNNSP